MTTAGPSTLVGRANNGIGAAVKWWLGELFDLLPARLRERRRARIEIHADEASVQLKIVHPTRPIQEGRIDNVDGTVQPPGFAHSIGKLNSRWPVWLFPPPSEIYSRSVRVPRAAIGRFDQFLNIEIDRWTPFSSNDVMSAWKTCDLTDQVANVEIRFATRSFVDRWEHRLASMGLTPRMLALGPEHEFAVALDRGRRSGSTNRRLTRRLSACFGALVLVAMTVDWLAAKHEMIFWQQLVDAERRQLVRQRGLEERIASVLDTARGDRTAAVSKTTFFSSLANSLPETDWFSEVSVRKDNVILQGFAENTELLLKRLEPLAANGSATLQGDLSFDPRLERNRFSIVFQIAEKMP